MGRVHKVGCKCAECKVGKLEAERDALKDALRMVQSAMAGSILGGSATAYKIGKIITEALS